MKNMIKNIPVLLGILFFSVSCENFLDVNPKGEVLQDELLSTKKGIENAMYGVYATMRKTNLYGRKLTHHSLDVMAQYYTSFGNDTVTALQKYEYKNSKSETLFFDIWCAMYNNISNVNAVLKALENQSPQTMKYYNLYKGEALGLRAFMHFDLLRIFSPQITFYPDADGIPYATQFSLKAPDKQKALEVYKRMIADLRTAEELLKDEDLYQYKNSDDKFLLDKNIHFNLNAVRATLARVYLTQGVKNDSALIYAEKVINSGKFQLMEKTELTKEAGALSSKETVFGLYYKGYYDIVLNDLYKSISFYSLDLRSDISKIYQKDRIGNDYRWDSYFYTLNKQYRVAKLTDKYKLENKEHLRPDNMTLGLNLIRLPEMYYIAAEAALKSDMPKALSYFNTLLESRGLTALDKRTPAESLTLEKISDDRYKEFIGEGQSFYNMKRLNQEIKDANGQIVPASNKVYVVDIPEQEFDYRK